MIQPPHPPNSVVIGIYIVPRACIYGQTLAAQIRDAMCGFRKLGGNDGVANNWETHF